MVRKLIFAIAVSLLAAACTNQGEGESAVVAERYTARVEVAAEQLTRVYDEDLQWSWTAEDSLTGYQVAGLNLRNTLTFVEATQGFVCEAFEYMSTDPAAFHFIYPASAEVEQGVLVAAQNGFWQPLITATIQDAVIDALPSITFEAHSAALELRVFEADKATPHAVVGAKLSSESDFVGRWTVNENLSYTQSLAGKEMVVADSEFNNSIVVFNMPDLPSGYGEGVELQLVLSDADGSTMTRTLPAMTFVKGKRTVLNIVYVADPTGGEGGEGGGEEPDTPITPEPEEPQPITGTFTCATYNVDGLPEKVLGFISLNGDGPGSSGTTSISQQIATSGWDFVTFQENFTYNDELESAMKSVYTFGTHRTFSIASALGTADTDGLGFATLNSTCSFSGETWWAFEHKEGGLTDGANTSIKKGIRHYVVTLKNDPNVVIDVLVTHMNTADNDAQIAAQDGQLQEVAAYINSICSNNRPIIFMGDMNTRYTRNDYQTNFWGVLDSSLTCADPWVEYQWAGVYPTLGSDALMTGDYGMQKGEVVDKIIYINNSNAAVQIKANNYLHDESYTYADHKPVVSEFTYTYYAD
ncbi:MAG: hypothetical protein IJO17_06335 [Alistipes sp.]|nr:hypothetical protein [Alistipes sp.]